MQVVAPVEFWNLPIAQGRHPEACEAVWNIPARQFVHTVAWMALENLPAEQIVHIVWPARENNPIEHDTQVAPLIAPRADENLPPAHRKHTVACVLF